MMPRKPVSSTPQNERRDDLGAVPDGKLDATPVFLDTSWLRSDATQSVFQTLNREGFCARIVGGAVRNALMNLPASDIDFATTALPQDVMILVREAGMSVHPTGIAHGTVTVVCQGQTFEVTTLRKDVSTDGRRATVAFSTSWIDDARRRDFSINALYCDGDGKLFDPLGGYADLLDRKVRFIGEAVERIREDYLRILRFFRFFASYNIETIDQSGLEACVSERSGIESLSGERIQGEMLRLLVGKNALQTLRIMDHAEILMLALGKPSNIDMFERLIAIEENLALPPDGLLRLGALTIEREEDVRAIARKLKLSNAQSRRLSRAVAQDAEDQNWNIPINSFDERTQRQALYRLGIQSYQDCNLLAWARSGDGVTDLARKNSYQLAQRWKAPTMPFSGADLMAHGFKPGPHIGKVLSQFETWWVQEDFPKSRELLEKQLMEFANCE